MEYSGYGYANPAGPNNGISQIATLLGFAVVDVNMRGTGCSGGAFNYFDTLQNLDGYDVIETVAHQPWALHHKVGMMGISYGGISQLFVAKTDPPDLAAIAPLSVIDNSATTLYPGGILNTGFALPWTKERDQDALANSPTQDQAWALQRIRGGDATCKANQALHQEAVNLVQQVRANSHYVPSVANPLSPITFVNKIKVPTYMACQFTDEQTGGHCTDLAEHFTGTRHKWFTFTNGVHADSLDPATFTRWYDFVELYVARRNPTVSAAAQALAPTLYQTALGVSGVTLPDDPIQHEPTLRSGAGRVPAAADDPGAVRQRCRRRVPGAYPCPGSSTRSRASRCPARRPARGTWDPPGRWLAVRLPRAGKRRSNGARPSCHRLLGQHRRGRAVGGHADLSLAAKPVGHVRVVRVGAAEVQHRRVRRGALCSCGSCPPPATSICRRRSPRCVRTARRRSCRTAGCGRASESSTRARARCSRRFRRSVRATCGRCRRAANAKLTVPLYYEGHAYRAGSRIRVTISAPNGSQPIWSFAQTVPRGHGTVSVAFSRKAPSRLVLPVIPGVAVPTPLPPCPGLRGEPCRTYVP